jgi:hypothetical protein
MRDDDKCKTASFAHSPLQLIAFLLRDKFGPCFVPCVWVRFVLLAVVLDANSQLLVVAVDLEIAASVVHGITKPRWAYLDKGHTEKSFQ